MPQLTKPAYLLLSLAVVVVDQWSKWLVERHLPLLSSKTVVPGVLDLTHVRNTGVAFGLFPAHGGLWGTVALTVLGFTALAVIAFYFRRTPTSHPLLLTSLTLILGGAVGNLIDRLFAGAVTDFIDFYVGTYHWHTFNVADSAITVGIVLMAVDALRGQEPEPAPEAAAEQ